MRTLALTFLICLSSLALAQVSNTTRNSLEEMYSTLGGSSWIHSDNWNEGDPCLDDWFGVRCDPKQTSVINLQLSSNNLTGALPDVTIPELLFMDLSDNSITGTLPEWSSLTQIQKIDVHHNKIKGNLPQWNTMENLVYFGCHFNEISGSLPEWSGMSSVEEIDFHHNKIDGVLPQWTNSMGRLQYLWGWSNQIAGTLPNWTWKTIQGMDISSNLINGTLPQWESLTSLSYLDLSYNYLCGELPQNSPSSNTTNLQGGENIFDCVSPPSWCTDCTCDPYNGQCCASNEYQGTEGVCLSCDPSCLTCNSTGCTSCGGNDPIYDPTHKICVANCSAGYFEQGSPPVCEVCNENCASCVSSPTHCTSCRGNDPILYQSTCVASCPSGYYEDTNGPSATCIACDSNCATCAGGPTNCTSCGGEESILYESTCVSSCPSGYYDDNTLPPTCQKCSSDCTACEGSPGNCSSCEGEFILYGSSCVSSCPSGYYVDGGSSLTCQECDPNCANCIGRADNCTSCHGEDLLCNSSCVPSCPDGYYEGDEIPPMCNKCSDNCDTCQLTATNCTSCDANGYVPLLDISSSTCVDECPQGDVQSGMTCIASPPPDSNSNSDGDGDDKRWQTVIIIVAFLILCCCCSSLLLVVICMRMKRKPTVVYEEIEIKDVPEFSTAAVPDLRRTTLTAEDFFKDPIVKTVKWSDVTMGAPIGQGASGVVRRGTLRQGNKRIPVAIKELHMGISELNLEEQVDFIREIRFLSTLKHKNIVGFIGASFPPNFTSLALLTELAGRGSWKNLLKYQPEVLTFPVRKRLAIGAANGIAYLHSRKLLHRDVKLDNLLVDEDWVCKVTDFGTSTQAPTISRSMTCTGTTGYIAPEVLTKDKYSKKADIFSFGMVMFELFLGRRAYSLPPFKDMSSALLNHSIIEGRRPDLSGLTNQALRALIEDCWDQDPQKRPELSTIAEILESLPDDDIQYSAIEGDANGFDTGDI